jgi:hypothetical protein
LQAKQRYDAQPQSSPQGGPGLPAHEAFTRAKKPVAVRNKNVTRLFIFLFGLTMPRTTGSRHRLAKMVHPQLSQGL